MSDAGLPPETPVPGGRRERRDRGGNPWSFSAVRGAVLIAVAIIIGVVLLQVIDDGSGPIGDGGANAGATTTTQAGSTSTGGNGNTTTTTGPVKPPAQVTVQVLNGSGVQGAAGTLTNTLKSRGYQTATAADAQTPRQGTVVYYQPGYARECSTVATIVGGNPQVAAMPTPPPAPAVSTANCVVVLGS